MSESIHTHINRDCIWVGRLCSSFPFVMVSSVYFIQWECISFKFRKTAKLFPFWKNKRKSLLILPSCSWLLLLLEELLISKHAQALCLPSDSPQCLASPCPSVLLGSPLLSSCPSLFGLYLACSGSTLCRGHRPTSQLIVPSVERDITSFAWFLSLIAVATHQEVWRLRIRSQSMFEASLETFLWLPCW